MDENICNNSDTEDLFEDIRQRSPLSMRSDEVSPCFEERKNPGGTQCLNKKSISA